MTAVTTDGLPAAPGTRNPVLAVLQRIGRSLMLPIAVLPAAGLLLRFGQPDMLGSGDTGLHLASRTGWDWVQNVANVFAAAGGALFTNLALLFAVGVAVGFARKSDGSTALAAVVGYLVFIEVIKALSTVTVDGQPVVEGDPKILGGVVIGIVTALLYQRYYRVKLPPYLAFFGGRRFVPIITAFVALFLGVLFANVWPWLGEGLNSFGDWLTDQGAVGAGIFGVVNRALLPLGLHHIVNSVVWFQFGDLTRFFEGDPEAGMFMTGFFPIMMFGLPAAAIAIWRSALPHNRKVIGGIMLSAALTSFVTGITEPIEFAFLFVAPLLYVIHALLTGLSLAIMEMLGVKDGFSFSAGFIDYAINWGQATKPWLIIPVGLVYAVVYYVVFTFAIRKFNLLTPGREPESDADASAPAPASEIPSGTEREPATAFRVREAGPGAAEPIS
jgi:PTS system N-acetylglucosamine-specific IIC component